MLTAEAETIDLQFVLLKHPHQSATESTPNNNKNKAVGKLNDYKKNNKNNKNKVQTHESTMSTSNETYN
eukprot:m.12466 g.12466  ORF g.12466 m.12466 type:complete len:69 (+) comp7215_c0_seq1:147-353(+)